MKKEEFISSISLPEEEWRDVIGFEGSYVVSNLGRVAIYPKIIGKNYRGAHLMKGRIITQHIQCGRPMVFLTEGGQGYRRFVENIIADAFMPIDKNKKCITHIDGDLTNCAVSNLKRTDISIPTEPGEEWRDIVGYEGLYKVSNYGRVYSTIIEFNGPKVKQHHLPRFLKTTKVIRNGKHYYNVNLTKDGNKTHKYLHRLIAEAFIPNPNNYTEIDHIDRDGTNNSVSNLRWCTHRQNQNNLNTRLAFSNSRLGVKATWNYVPVVQLKDGEAVKIYESIASVKADGFLPSAVSNCITGKSQTHRGYKWMRKSDYESLVSMSKNSTPKSD